MPEEHRIFIDEEMFCMLTAMSTWYLTLMSASDIDGKRVEAFLTLTDSKYTFQDEARCVGLALDVCNDMRIMEGKEPLVIPDELK